METARLILEKSTRSALNKMLKQAEKKGDIRGAKRIMAILLLAEGLLPKAVASALGVVEKTVLRWLSTFLMKGPVGLTTLKSPGRKPKLTQSQRKELAGIIEKGPAKAGFPGACWRSPMIQSLIYERFGVFYAVNYISQLLRNMGFSFQKAAFVPARSDALKRKKWLRETWPAVLSTAKKKNAMILWAHLKKGCKSSKFSFTFFVIIIGT